MTSNLGMIIISDRIFIGSILSDNTDYLALEDAFQLITAQTQMGPKIVGAYIGWIKIFDTKNSILCRIAEKSEYQEIYNDCKKRVGLGIIYGG